MLACGGMYFVVTSTEWVRERLVRWIGAGNGEDSCVVA